MARELFESVGKVAVVDEKLMVAVSGALSARARFIDDLELRRRRA